MHVESISRQKTTSQSLSLNYHRLKIASLTLNKGLLVVVCLSTNWTGSLLLTFRSHEFFKVLETRTMVHVWATQNRLFFKLKIFKTDWARLVIGRPFGKVVLNLVPLVFGKWLRWLVDKFESFGKTQLIYILHSFFLNVLKGALLALMTLSKHLFCGKIGLLIRR